MKDVAYVYLPDDEPDVFWFNGTQFKLTPNTWTELSVPDDAAHWKGIRAAEIATHAEVSLGKYGIRVVPNEVVEGLAPNNDPAVLKLSQDKFAEIKAQAEAAYLSGTKEWATNLMLSYADRSKKLNDAGLPCPPNEHEAAARAWLVKYGFLSN